MKLQKICHEDFAAIYEQMEKNFILAERRDFAPAYELFTQEKYSIYHLVDNEEKVGFISLWQIADAVYVEHFVIYEQYRNKGYGGKALELVKQENNFVVLEAELPEDELTTRRIGFYQRNGFVRNEQPYVQPAYRQGGQEVAMVLMSYPNLVENFDQLVQELQRCVYGKS
ncbi:MAG: GNAT family N-acetyltransferase [Peptococcaceae bacterium]|nr:GNAT family N-acetyltransferase [Peptococcaceae bacterium]